MDKLFVDIITNAGPLVIMAGIFLLWDYRKDSIRVKEREELSNRLLKAVDDNTKASTKLSEVLQTRPCLWEKETQKFMENMSMILETAIERIVKGVNDRNGGKNEH